MNLLSDNLILGDFLSPFNQSFLAADESLGLLDEDIEVSGYLPSHGFSSEKAKNGVSNLLPLAPLFGSFQGDAFSGMDWMVEKMDLKEFDFDSLLGMEDLESTVSPDELMATLDDSCDLLEDPPIPSLFDKYMPSFAPISIPKGPLEADQVAPMSPTLAEFNISIPDHSFILYVESEVDVAEEDKKSAIYTLETQKYKKEDSSANDSSIYVNPLLKSEKEDSSDDSGVYMSPSYLGSPQQSPASTVEYPSSVQSSPSSPISERPKPYDLPCNDKDISAKVKTVGHPRVDKKTKKMEQNKTAANRYRQKKKAEQELISAECRELEQKNDSLNEKADSIAKEIQYLKDLMEEVRKAKSKRAKSS
ncbi:cyclic AMP-dependent transcription factor ATF-4-like [Rana temporaria]|uniref:cyclic AMP-dependent transcription factor ATF-4-like n=1 Tax=Rana temporaria TaxID=8407 RepID=UPI001AADE0EC|nr:cyclic AMP-dependent transcription factor ATF-4-like [Rana temporaria]